jgi:hypothetical protein
MIDSRLFLKISMLKPALTGVKGYTHGQEEEEILNKLETLSEKVVFDQVVTPSTFDLLSMLDQVCKLTLK